MNLFILSLRGKAVAIPLLLVFVCCMQVFSAGTNVFDFLNISQSARPLALSGACLDTNPAGLSLISNRQISLAHTEWLDNVQYENAIFVSKLNKSNGFGFEFNYLHMGQITGRDSYGRKTNDFTSRDIYLGFAYGSEISKGHSIGVKIKYISEQIANFETNTIALDIGILHKTPIKNLTAGLKIENIGSPVKFIKVNEPLPTKIWTGLGYKLFDSLTLVLDSGFSSKEPSDIRLGMEYNMSNLGSLRAGFKNKTSSGENDMFSFGFGIVRGSYDIDYAYVPFGLLGDTHRISFTRKFTPKPDKYFLRLYKEKKIIKEMPLD